MKKYIWRAVMATVLIAAGTFLLGRYLFPAEKLAALPKPQVSEGERGQLGIDKNINESNIDDYLGRSDSVYRDMRMLIDPADYEAIGGDSYLSGFVEGFDDAFHFVAAGGHAFVMVCSHGIPPFERVE